MKDLQLLVELQRFGLTHPEILSVHEDDREELLNALKECEEKEVSYLSVLEAYVTSYRKYDSFEEFLTTHKG